jgi:hypothetical protein
VGRVGPEFGSSVNLPTRVADYAHHFNACSPGFENLTHVHLVQKILNGLLMFMEAEKWDWFLR